MFSVGDLFILNFLTIATEFIGISLALGYFGVSEYLSVPIAAVSLIAMTATGSFRRWERFMFIFIVVNFLVIPLAFMSHPPAQSFFKGFVTPGVQGGFNSTSVLLIIAIVGTTVAPWQLFFQQSNIVDKRITPRWINYERADTFVGSLRRPRRRPAHGDRGGGLLRHRDCGALHQCRRRRPGPAALRGAGRRDDLRHHPPQRVHHRGGGGHALHVLRVR